MKPMVLLILVGCALFSGYATPLTQATDGERLANVVGVPQANVNFISYCDFTEARNWEKPANFTAGIIVVTSDGLQLLGGDLGDVSTKREIMLTNDRMKGVNLKHFGRGRQIQIWTDEHIVVIEVTANRGTVDQAASEHVFQILKSRGVMPHTSEDFYFPAATPTVFVPVFIQ